MAESDNRTRIFPGLAKQLKEQENALQPETKAAPTPAHEPARQTAADMEGKGTVLPFRRLPEEPNAAPQTWADDGGKRRFSGRLLLRLLLLVLLVVAVFAVVWSTSADFDALRRGYTYRGVSRDERGVTELQALPLERSAVGRMGRRVVLASQMGLQVLDEDGSALANVITELEQPVLCANSKVSLAYDAGGTALCVVDSSMHETLVTTEAPLLAADVAANGAFCCLTSPESEKAVLTVYSSKCSEVFSWYSKSRYLTAVALSDNGQLVAAIGAGTTDGAYHSTLQLLRTDRETPVADVDLGEALVLWADWIDGVCCLVCHDRVLFFSAEGVQLGSWQLGLHTVTGAAAGDDVLVLSLSEGRTSDRDVLLMLALDGTPRAELTLGRAAEQISAAGNYVSVLTPQGVLVYTGALESYGELEETGDLQACHMREDGSVLLVSAQGTALYLP